MPFVIISQPEPYETFSVSRVIWRYHLLQSNGCIPIDRKRQFACFPCDFQEGSYAKISFATEITARWKAASRMTDRNSACMRRDVFTCRKTSIKQHDANHKGIESLIYAYMWYVKRFMQYKWYLSQYILHRLNFFHILTSFVFFM